MSPRFPEVTVTFTVEQVCKITITPASAVSHLNDGHLRIRGVLTKRVRGVRTCVLSGEVVESGERVTIQIVENPGADQ